MAQVEIIMYVALGFATAALIALLLGGVLWSLAVSVGRRRAQRISPPPAVAELQAERNQLRAEYAMLARRVEVRLDDLKREVAENRAEVARSRNRVDRLGAEIDQRDAILAERDREIARLKDQAAALVSELEARTETVGELEAEQRKREDTIAALNRQLAERDEEIGRLRAEAYQLGLARSEAVSRERNVQERLKGRIADLSDLSRQIEAQRRRLLDRQSQSVALRDTMVEQQRQPGGPLASGEETWGPEPVEGDGDAREGVGDGAPLERQIEDVDRQAHQLQRELEDLDEIWTAKLADVARAVASAPPNEASSEPPPLEPADDAALPSPPPGDAVGVPDEVAAGNGSAEKPVAGHAREQGAAPAETTLETARHGSEAADDDKKSASGLANVISLAQRIRALQRNDS